MTEKAKNMFRRSVTVVLAVFAITVVPELYATTNVDVQPSDFVLFDCRYDEAYGGSVVVLVDRSHVNADGVQMGDGCANALAKINQIDATCSVSACSAVGPGCWSASCDLKARSPEDPIIR